MKVTRREMLRGGSALAAACGVMGGCSAGETEPELVASCCRICTVTCGIDVWKEGDKVVRVYGRQQSPTQGFICANGLALPEILASPRRVRAPLIRQGDTLRPASWDEALGFIAERVAQVRGTHGAKGVAFQTGWAFVYRNLVGWLKRLADAVGTPNFATSSSICVAASRMASMLTFGRIGSADMQRTDLCVAWGWNPMHSSPPLANVLLRNQRRGMQLVVVDPYRTRLARAADIHLPLRPGTDLSLALGLLGVIVRDRLFDEQVVTSATEGFDALAEVVEPLSPEWAAEQTGLPPEAITGLAREIARSESACGYTGVALEQSPAGLQTCRAVDILWGITGNAGRPGGKRLLPRLGTEAETAARQLSPRPPEITDPAIGQADHPLFASLVGEAQGNFFPKAILERDPYPLAALFVFGANPILSSPGSEEVRRALEALDLLVVADPMMTETAELADVVLPVATFLETDDFVAMRNVGEMEAVVPPPGQAWPDWKVVFELARHMDLGQYFPWETGRDARRAQAAAMARQGGGLQGRFPTPSGKIEIFSPRLEEAGQDPVPRPLESPSPPEGYPLLLTTGPRQPGFCNSQVRHIPMVEQRVGPAGIEVSPALLDELSLQDGGRARIETTFGSLEVIVYSLPGLRDGVVRIPHCMVEANANELTSPHHGSDPVSGFANLRALPCRIEPA